MSVNSRLKTTSIIGQLKALHRHRIPELSCAKKETVDIDILVTSRNGDRKIMRSIKIMSRPPFEEEEPETLLSRKLAGCRWAEWIAFVEKANLWIISGYGFLKIT